MTNLDQTLLERGCRYGSFVDVAQRTNNIFASILNGAPQLPSTTPLYREALHMIALKVARLVQGTINDADSWRDIAGYAMLVHNHIEQETANLNARTGNGKQEQQAKAAANLFTDKAVIDAMEAEIAQELKEA